MSQILKHITVSERNYYALKRLGHAGDSFNDVVDKLLEKISEVGPSFQAQNQHLETQVSDGGESTTET